MKVPELTDRGYVMRVDSIDVLTGEIDGKPVVALATPGGQVILTLGQEAARKLGEAIIKAAGEAEKEDGALTS